MKTQKLHQFDILARWFGEYLTLKNYRPRTIQDYTFELSLFRRWLTAQPSVDEMDDLKREHLSDYTATLYERQLAITTIAHKLAVLRSFFATLYKENKMYRDFTPVIVLPKIGRQLPKNILSIEEIEQLFSALEQKTNFVQATTKKQAKALRNQAILEVLYSCALRHAELRNLKLEHIDYSHAVLLVKEGKGGKDRMVPVGAVAMEAVIRYVEEGRRFLLASKSDSFLFLSQIGGALGKDSTSAILKNALRDAGIEKHLRVHDMRHTCATHLLNNGADIRYVQELLGHADLSATQIYTHVAIDDLKRKHEQFHPRERWSV